MSEREGPTWPGEGKAVAAEVAERLRSILADAESAAEAIRHQADQDAQARRRAAETDALKIIEDARREAERFLADRIHRVSALSDEILERGQSVVERLDEAEQVRGELADLVRALGETAARLANEVRSMPGPHAPELSPPAPAPEAGQKPAAEPDPEPEADPEPPLVEPTPLRRGPIEPNPIEPLPAAGAQQGADAELGSEAPRGPSPEESELLERVRAAERERGEGDPSQDEHPAADADVDGPPAPQADGDGPDLVPVAAAGDEQAAADARHDAAGAGPDQALGARLVALQMAVAGGNRGEVEAHLRRAFDLDQPADILDDIFGSGTTSDKRVVWPEAG